MCILEESNSSCVPCIHRPGKSTLFRCILFGRRRTICRKKPRRSDVQCSSWKDDGCRPSYRCCRLSVRKEQCLLFHFGLKARPSFGKNANKASAYWRVHWGPPYQDCKVSCGRENSRRDKSSMTTLKHLSRCLKSLISFSWVRRRYCLSREVQPFHSHISFSKSC